MKKLIVGFTAGMLIGSAATAFADNIPSSPPAAGAAQGKPKAAEEEA
ncbi:hypothetical protein [Paenibacillus sp. OAS669]|nr:hypothetical protein [Paenibacillus sp. OAS669]MBE1440628.1 hypothetical protein [Paenibacillus sp. OAS669]